MLPVVTLAVGLSVVFEQKVAGLTLGGEVFEDTAVIIAHKNKYEAIID